jgi:NAD-reducing hydrogenase large subunit
MAERRTIRIDPVTRVEGHASISIFFDAQGAVSDARLHVSEYRGFEAFCEGHLIWEMPRLTSRICGVCPVSHAVTSACAGDDILAVAIPRTAENLRRVLILAQWVQSHALSFFHFTSPDLLAGNTATPAERNMFGLMHEHGDFLRRGIRLRKWAQEVVARIAGARIHADYVIPGGVRAPLSVTDRDIIFDGLPEAHATTRQALDFIKAYIETQEAELQMMGVFPSLFLGMTAENGDLEYYGGSLRIIDSNGNILADRLPPRRYRDVIAETSERWSYMTFPHYAPLGPVKGMYRVGPLARLNICSRTGSPKSDRELLEYRSLAAGGGSVQHSFFHHYARLIEVLFALERIEELLSDPETLRKDSLRSRAFSNRAQGLGCTEAPRGTLFHNYSVTPDGVLRHVDLLIATAQNNLAMNRTIRQIATHLIPDMQTDVDDGILNSIEAGIRAYDPCFSCATHARGKMPLRVSYHDARGREIRRFAR